MYLNTYLDWSTIDISQYAMENTTYSTYYMYWRDELFGRVMRLIKLKSDPIPPKEVAIRLFIQGHCGIAQMPYDVYPGQGGLTAFFGTFNGISKYRDEKPYYCVHSPVWSANLKIGEEIVVINNNTLRNPLLDLVHHYAQLLAHTDVTYVHTMVNARKEGGIPIVTNNNQKASISSYLRNLFNGKFDVMTDLGAMGTDTLGQNVGTGTKPYELWNTRERIIASFLSDIGVKSGLDKNSNSVEDEVNAQTPSLLINLEDMVGSWQEGCEEVNDMFGTDWSAELNPQLNYVNDFVKGGEKDAEAYS